MHQPSGTGTFEGRPDRVAASSAVDEELSIENADAESHGHASGTQVAPKTGPTKSNSAVATPTRRPADVRPDEATTPTRNRPARRFVQRSAIYVTRCVLVVAFVGLALHFWIPRGYEYTPIAPFSGASWHNPYDNDGDERLRAMFHAHALTWGGMANENQSVEELYEAYKDRGYDVVGISNYQSIRDRLPGEEIFVTTYEHGWSLIQQHHTVIGAGEVRWLDFPWLQLMDHKQYVIDELEQSAELVIINHPNKNSVAWFESDFENITGYDGVEIRSRFAKKGTERYWDAALSAGRPIWGYMSDDCHDINRGHVGRGWIRVRSKDRSESALLDAMRNGQFVCHFTLGVKHSNELIDMTVADNTLQIDLERPADFVSFIADGGVERHRTGRTAHAEYTIDPDDTYVRVEAWTRGSRMATQPVFRSVDGTPPVNDIPPVSTVRTAGLRGIALLLTMAAFLSFRFGRTWLRAQTA